MATGFLVVPRDKSDRPSERVIEDIYVPARVVVDRARNPPESRVRQERRRPLRAEDGDRASGRLDDEGKIPV